MNILELLAKELQECGFKAEYIDTPISDYDGRMNHWKENERPSIRVTFFSTAKCLRIFKYMVWQRDDYLYASDFRHSDEQLGDYSSCYFLRVDYRDPNSITDIINYLSTKRQDILNYERR